MAENPETNTCDHGKAPGECTVCNPDLEKEAPTE